MNARAGEPETRDLSVRPNDAGHYSIAPTDVAQFIRLEQCARYLRLRLHERSAGLRFMIDYGVVPQAIPPLLTRSGASFETAIERDIRGAYPCLEFRKGRRAASDHDNAAVLEAARGLAPNASCVLFQPRIAVPIGRWHLRGDIDVVRLSRDARGQLQLLVADMKSSTSGKLEHRLQVAFYVEMLEALFAGAGEPRPQLAMGILYRGSAHGDAGLSDDERAERAAQRDLARVYFATEQALFDLVDDTESYRDTVRDLVTGSESLALQVSTASFDNIPFHLSYKCDGCLYNEFCMKWCAERDDLSLLPQITALDKSALQRAGVNGMRELATLKDLSSTDDGAPSTTRQLVTPPGNEALVRRLAATWPVGPRLDELVHRARRYRRWRHDAIDALSIIPSKGYGTLPYSDAEQNPNLVTVYIDAQHDYLNDRIYLISALVVAREGGLPVRRQSVVRMTEGPPEHADQEAELLLGWIEATIGAIVDLAAPDEQGLPRAPIHLVFFNHFDQRLLLDALARHFETILAATPLYDFMTQLASYDSPLVTFLDQEIRELKNYPMVCQSLQAVAAYLRFDWNSPEPYRDLFRARLFDFWAKLDQPAGQRSDDESPWYFGRARFNSQIPLEYAYAAWGELEAPPERGADELAPFRRATPALLARFQARRLEALERVAADFRGNKQTQKTPFRLPDLASFAEKATTLAQALDEFVTIERHVELNSWKSIRLAPPERRALQGETLLVRYYEEDQDPGVAERNRDNERRRRLREVYEDEFRARNPGAAKVRLTKEQRQETEWSPEGLRIRLRLALDSLACDLDEALALSTIRPGALLVLCPRTEVDSRLPPAQQVPFTPTPKQMLYGARAALERVMIERDQEGRAVSASVEIELRNARGGPWSRGFVFPSSFGKPLQDGQLYTLDADPNSWYGYWCAKATEELCAGRPNTLYQRIENPSSAIVSWPDAAAAGQRRFLDGLDAFHALGALHPFEPSKRDYIGSHGAAPILLVQGPPGTGKSYTTAFAVFARIQGAMAAGQDLRAIVSCKTHAATDVLLENLRRVQDLLGSLAAAYPERFDEYFDRRLLDVPHFRVQAREVVPDGVIALAGRTTEAEAPLIWDVLKNTRWSVTAATPGGVYRLVKDRWDDNGLLGHTLVECLVLDETSQMNIPEAVLAALPLKADGQLIVVGDHRQMPPIVQHNWEAEPRRTFKEFQSYESLFFALQKLEPPMIKFAESFRLHADMAEFLRREIYQQDGIAYRSHRNEVLPTKDIADPFVAAVLAPEHPIVVVVHDEAASQVRNAFEQALITPILEALADPELFGLEPETGLGVVVPHRAQRAALQDSLPMLNRLDPDSGLVKLSAVDTVERFQGGERTVILVSATESDRDYLLNAGEFLLDPRRLTVALSRAKRKMVLVAARSIFNLFSTDEAVFQNSLLWKHLLRRTCTVPLWAGEVDGQRVEVWGNVTDSAVLTADQSRPRPR